MLLGARGRRRPLYGGHTDLRHGAGMDALSSKEVNQSALRVEGQKHRLFPQSHFVDGIEPRAPKGASAKMCLCVYVRGFACAWKQRTSRFSWILNTRVTSVVGYMNIGN